MTVSLSERLVNAITRKAPTRTRRGFLGSAALAGTALAVNPWSYLVRPASAYDAVCGDNSTCADGYTVFCCTINNGRNSCPPNSFIGGWWKADNAAFCGGSARYYVDCNAFRGDPSWQCHCAEGTCDQRRVACNQFRYGQCSLEVPTAQSGPVVCRLVSCTPPWQQYAGVCTTTSATDNRTATHSAPCVGGPDPRGNLDGIGADGQAVRLRGWAYDPDQPDAEVQVAVYRDGAGIAWYPTGVPRSDVNAVFGVTGNHGFDITVPTAPGRYTFTVYAINVGPGSNPALGSAAVTVVEYPPIGNLDEAEPGPDGTIRLRGWAFDPDQPATAIPVAVYRDGEGVAWFPTGRSRPDVNSVFGITGEHGFDLNVPSGPGNHTVSIFGIDLGTAGNPLIASRIVTGVGLPRGTVDSATPVSGGAGQVHLQGWAYDPDQPAAEIQVSVSRGTTVVGTFATGVARPDVNAVFGLTGDHGFDFSFRPPAGTGALTVSAINVGAEAPNQPIGTFEVSQ